MIKKTFNNNSNLDSKVNNWIEYFNNRGVSLELIDEYKTFIHNVVTLKLINNPDEYYRKFDIKKRKGGKREILAPLPSLLHCQRWIYKEILTKSTTHNNAHGFIANRSIITNASLHLNKKCILKMDIKDFFPGSADLLFTFIF